MIFREGSICVICGVAPATTRDHVPPRAFFKGMGAGLRLITVPACQACNNGASKLDEQLRLYVSLEVGKPTSDAAALCERGALRSLEVSQGLRRMLAGNYGYAIDPATGNLRDAVEVPVSLVEAVIGRVVRGLHFHHTGRILPPDVKLVVDKMGGPTDLSSGDLSMLAEGSVGGDAFRYRWGIAGEDETAGLWVLQFHRAATFFVQTGATAES